MRIRFNFIKLRILFLLMLIFFLGYDLEVLANVSQEARTIVIMASVFPLVDFAKQVGGEFGEVEMLLPPGVEVHTWRPRPSDIVKLSRADLFIHIGKHMEPWLTEILRGVSNPDIVVLEASQGLHLEEGEHHHEHGAESADPHIWLDFEYDVLIVKKIADTLCKLDPDHSEYFLSKADSYQEKLRLLDQKYRVSLETCKHRTLIIGGHAAFGYLAKRYNLNQVALYGINPESRPTPRQLKEVVDLARKLDVKTIFTEEFVSDELAKVISREVGLRTLELNPGANLTRAQYYAGLSFLDIMEKNLENLKDGLSCK